MFLQDKTTDLSFNHFWDTLETLENFGYFPRDVKKVGENSTWIDYKLSTAYISKFPLRDDLTITLQDGAVMRRKKNVQGVFVWTLDVSDQRELDDELVG
jgi:hypothetical protein